MVHLSSIHIPGEVFQNSEGYLEPSRAPGVQGFQYASGVVLLYTIYVIRILAWPLKFSSEKMLFLVNIWAEEHQLYKTELLYLYLLKIYKNF